MILRPIQIPVVEAGINFFSKPNDPSIIVGPTAFGKSLIIAKIVEGIHDKVIVIQPSVELLTQNIAKYGALGGRATIFSASAGEKLISQVTYCTIGSIHKLGAHFKKYGFTKMIIDEIHLYPRSSSGMLQKFIQESGITHVLGLTATAFKLQSNLDRDGNPFSQLKMLTSKSSKGQFFKHIIYVSQVKEMVDNKYWSPLIYERHDIDDSRLVYNSTKADYTEESMELMYNENHLHDKILKSLQKHSDRKSVLIFVSSVEEAKRMAQTIPNAVAVYGDMDSKVRKQYIDGFKSGSIRVVVNVNVLSVGFDHTGLDMIICARPTASLAWYYQALGRGTRIQDGKKDCLIVDYSGNCNKFGRIEELVYKKEGAIWKLYGEGGILLTGIPLHKVSQYTETGMSTIGAGTMPFGRYRGKELSDIPMGYISWALENLSWNESNAWIKKEFQQLKQNTVL